jgi:hypothetical protein
VSGKRLPSALVKRANDQLTAEHAISNGNHSGPIPLDAPVAEESSLSGQPIVVRLSEVEPERVTWLAPGVLPLGKVVLLEGDPGTSKSTLTLDIAARITRGQAILGAVPTEPRNVVLVTFEDGLADTVRPRFDALGGDPERVSVLRGITIGVHGDEREPTFPEDTDRRHAERYY